MPTMNPRRRTSATASSGATSLGEQLAEQRDLRLQALERLLLLEDASVASAAAHASGLPVYVWPWKNVRNCSWRPRKPS